MNAGCFIVYRLSLDTRDPIRQGCPRWPRPTTDVPEPVLRKMETGTDRRRPFRPTRRRRSSTRSRRSPRAAARTPRSSRRSSRSAPTGPHPDRHEAGPRTTTTSRLDELRDAWPLLDLEERGDGLRVLDARGCRGVLHLALGARPGRRCSSTSGPASAASGCACSSPTTSPTSSRKPARRTRRRCSRCSTPRPARKSSRCSRTPRTRPAAS